MATAKKTAAEAPRKNVEIFVGEQCCGDQPSTFTLCPLGMQFYSPKKITDLSLLELNVNIDGRKSPVTCTGAVVRCQRDVKRKSYRVWVQFLDLPDKHREKIRCASRDGKHLCCYCENF